MSFIIGGFFVWQYFGILEKAEEKITEDETADWQTYKNQPMGFSIKYPKEWIWIFPQLYKQYLEDALAMELKKEDPYPSCRVLFLKSTPINKDTGKEVSFKDLVASEKQVLIQIPIKNLEVALEELVEEEIMVDKIQATKLSYLFFYDKSANSQGQQISRIFIPLGANEIFHIAYYADLDSYDCQLEFNRMLSTFKFLE